MLSTVFDPIILNSRYVRFSSKHIDYKNGASTQLHFIFGYNFVAVLKLHHPAYLIGLRGQLFKRANISCSIVRMIDFGTKGMRFDLSYYQFY